MRLSQPLAQFGGIVAVVTACCATGSWIQNRSSANAIQSRIAEQMGVEIAAKAKYAAGKLPADWTENLDEASRIAAFQSDATIGVMLASQDWSSVVDPGSLFAAGQRLTWKGPVPKPGAGSLMHGYLNGPDDLRLACAVPLGPGFVVASVPQRAIDARSRPLIQSLTNSGWMAFLWMCAILWPALWMVLSRGRKSNAHDDRPLVRLKQAQEVVRTRDAIVFGLAKLTESRSPETGNHLERISAYVTVLARALRRHPQYQDRVTAAFVRRIGACCVLHDIGKVGIEDSVLLKQGRFNAEDKLKIQQHTIIGAECLGEIDRRLGGSGFLKMAQQIAAAHHERWDGSGYPNGLAGEAIPLSARIVAIADVYDALSVQRVYKDARTHEDCVEHICAGAGAHFDPQLVDVWLTVAGRFRDIAERFAADELIRGQSISKQPIEIVADELEGAEEIDPERALATAQSHGPFVAGGVIEC